jgi:hypothetical protein
MNKKNEIISKRSKYKSNVNILIQCHLTALTSNFVLNAYLDLVLLCKESCGEYC